MRQAGGALMILALAGCSSSLNPVNWWHGLQGGRIAEERPAPPNADAPYPNLSTVPARPTPPDRDAMKRLTESLVGDRTHAQYTAEAAPLADPSSPQASPGLFGAGTLPPPPPAPPPGSAPLSASLPAASAPPPPPNAPVTPPSPAPQRPVQSQALEAPPVAPAPGVPAPEVPATAAPAPSAAPPPTPAASAPAASTGSEPMPELPSTPPARAAAAPPPPPPVAQPAPPSPAAEGGVTLGFAPGSSQLSPTAADAVKRFLVGRVGQPIAVLGHGDATSSDPASQTAAVSLALTRAQAVVNALTAAGVPRTAITIGAEAAGRGATLRLLQ